MPPTPCSRSLGALLLTLLLPLFVFGGCATNSPRDPLEPMNRAIYSFNDGVDTALIQPVAKGYRAVLPMFVRTGVSNVFANINDVLIALNNLLQGKLVNAISDVGRVLINTTVGVAGIFDVATHFGLEKHNEDFGQTLGYWGVGDGPYLVLPLIGPSNLRDAVARVVDFKTDPITYVRSMRLRNSLWGTRALSQRADLLDTSKILEIAALDPYEFLRDAYLQRRRNLVYDGAPPREKDDRMELRFKPQAESPYPRSASDDSMSVGTNIVTMRNEDWTPARAAGFEAASKLAVAPPAAPLQASAQLATTTPEQATATPSLTAPEPLATQTVVAIVEQPQAEISISPEPTAAAGATQEQPQIEQQ